MIVAGGTAGFGLVLARHLAAAGARPLIVGRSSEGVREALCAAEEAGAATDAGRIRGLAADLERPGEGERVAAEAVRLLGGLDDLFFCVGRSGRGRILDTDRDELRSFLETNLGSAAEITRAVADDVARARGHLVYMGSLAGKLVTPFMGPYAVAKAALAAYVDAVRLEMEPRGAHVLLVSPGPIRRAAADPAAARAADRYHGDVQRAGLPAEALRPGGTGAVAPLDPDHLAAAVLSACAAGANELVVPRKAAILAGLIAWFPGWGRRLLRRLASRGD